MNDTGVGMLVVVLNIWMAAVWIVGTLGGFK